MKQEIKDLLFTVDEQRYECGEDYKVKQCRYISAYAARNLSDSICSLTGCETGYVVCCDKQYNMSCPFERGFNLLGLIELLDEKQARIDFVRNLIKIFQQKEDK